MEYSICHYLLYKLKSASNINDDASLLDLICSICSFKNCILENYVSVTPKTLQRYFAVIKPKTCNNISIKKKELKL